MDKPNLTVWVWPLALVLITVLLYAPFISSPPFFDDLNYFDHSAEIIREGFLFAPRWLSRWTLGRTFEYFGTGPEAFRIGNLAIHAGVAIALFYLTRTLLRIAKPATDWSLFAFAGALLFAVHPVAAFSAGYIVQRTMLMTTLFSLLGWLAFVRASTGGRPMWLYVSVLCYLLACLAKEHAVTGYAVFLALLVWLQRSDALVSEKTGMRRHFVFVFLLYSIVAGLVVAGKAGIFFVPYEPDVGYMMESMPIDKNLVYPLSVLTQMGLFFKYVFLWVVPNTSWMSVDMREPFAQTFSEWPYIAAAVVFCAYLTLSVALLWRGGITGLTGVLLLIPGLMFATELTTVRIQEPLVLYRSYLWMPVAYALAFAIALNRLDRKLVGFILVLMTAAFTLFTANQLFTFSSSVFVWDQAAEAAEGRSDLIGLDRIYHNRGLAYYDLGFADNAMRDYNKAIEIAPNIPTSYLNRGALYYDLRKYPEALADFNHVLSMVPARNAYMGRGLVFAALGDQIAAQREFSEACRRGMAQACKKLPVAKVTRSP